MAIGRFLLESAYITFPDLEGDIAEAIGRSLDVPVTSIAPEEAEEHFGWFIKFAGNDLMASSTITQEKLGWTPTGPSLIEDLKHMRSV